MKYFQPLSRPLSQESFEIVIVGVVDGDVYLAATWMMAHGVEQQKSVVASLSCLIMMGEAVDNLVGCLDVASTLTGVDIAGELAEAMIAADDASRGTSGFTLSGVRSFTSAIFMSQ